MKLINKTAKENDKIIRIRFQKRLIIKEKTTINQKNDLSTLKSAITVLMPSKKLWILWRCRK